MMTAANTAQESANASGRDRRRERHDRRVVQRRAEQHDQLVLLDRLALEEGGDQALELVAVVLERRRGMLERLGEQAADLALDRVDGRVARAAIAGDALAEEQVLLLVLEGDRA